MPCIERSFAAQLLCVAALLSACTPARPPAPPRPAPAPPPATTTAPAPAPAAPVVQRARNWDEYREQAARRIVAANADRTYLGAPPDPLLAIPVLELQLNADGSINRIRVLREPHQARDTVQLAIDAVRRAAPFASPSHLPQPWQFVETFLFDDERRFKPRTLDLR